MNSYLLYLTGSGLSLGLFYLIYWLFLRNTTTHKFCRFYLIAVTVVALIIPMINVPFKNLSSATKSNNTIIKIADTKNEYERFLQTNRKSSYSSRTQVDNVISVGTLVAKKQGNSFQTSLPLNISLLQLLMLIYIAGSVYFLVRLLAQLAHILFLIRKYKSHKAGHITYVFMDKEISPFSFFNHIFINKNNYSSVDYYKIIEHEKVHIMQHHTLDVLIAELLAIVQWFNPFIWLLKDSIKKTHEYLADKGVLMQGHDMKEYQALLLQQLIYPNSFQLTNSFNFKPIKKRLAMMTKIQFSQNNKYKLLKLLPVFVVTCIAIAIGIIISCTNSKTQHYNIVEIKGDGEHYNYSKFWGSIVSSDSVHPSALLAENGDLLMLDDNLVYLYQGQDKVIEFNHKKTFYYVNGKIYSITVSKETDLLPWFKQMKASDISALQAMYIASDKIPESYYPYLKEIAKTKPKLGLFFDKIGNINQISKIFSPAWMFIGEDISQKDFNILSGLKDLETLGIALKDSIISTELPKLPKLKQIILFGEKENKLAETSFFKNNTQIERLIVPATLDYSFLEPLKNLKELTLLGDKEDADADDLRKFKKLEVLRFISGEGAYKNISSINELPDLRWLALPASISQLEFNSIIVSHKNLEVLEILRNDSIRSLSSLLQLDNLYGLVITSKSNEIDTATLRSLKNLTYLSIPKDAYKDSIQTARLRKSLPNCTIVPNHGFCLGSGWLLLLIPFVLIFRLLQGRSRTVVFKPLSGQDN